MKIFKFFLQACIILILLGFIVLASLYLYVKSDIPSVEVLKDVELQTPMQVFTKDGKLINQFGEKRRIPITLQQVPPLLKNAFIATEDSRFYQHLGIDPIGILRSAVVLVSTGEKKQGASTITMQLARNFFLTREKAYIRKVKEIFIALNIEQLLTKDEIFELYLNKIELGNRAFGVGAAAQVYYGKNLDELTLPQMAMIAGLPKAPSALNPIRNPKRAKKRRNVVLGRMLDEKYITQQEYNEAIAAPITASFHGAEIDLYAPYISEMVRAELVALYGEDTVYTSGFKVYTSVDSTMQIAAQQALRRNLYDYDMRHGYRGAEGYLWDPQVQPPLDKDTIVAALNKEKHLADLTAAVVLAVQEQSVTILTSRGEEQQILWDGLKWARKYISATRQGAAPKTAGEILTAGAKIWVRTGANGENMLAQIPDASSALVSINPKTGRIKAVVGGFSFQQSQYNRAVQANRQIGSNIKPFIYSAALEHGYTLASVINDAPINHWDKSRGVAWRPKNSPPIYDGPVRVRRALAQSKNVVSVRLLRGVGIARAASHLEKFGFNPDAIPRNETLALGSASLTPLELATGMSVFANGGYMITPYFISEIQDASGAVLFKADPAKICAEEKPEPTQLTSEIAAQDASMTSLEEDFAAAIARNDNAMEKEQPQAEQTDSLAQTTDSEPAPTPATEPENCAVRVLSKHNAFLIADSMKSTIWGGGNWSHNTGWNGTGWRAQQLDRRDLSGKTGTTNNSVDTWFTGFNQNVLTTVWVGFDNPSMALGRTGYNNNLDKNQSFGGESGAKTALPAWIDFMQVALKDEPFAPIEQPDGLVSVRIDLASGLLSRDNDYTSRFEYFIKGTAPTRYSEMTTPSPFDLSSGDNSTTTEEEELF